MAKYETKIEDIDECPHCGSTFGYYTRIYVSGWTQDNTLFNGEKYNYNMNDHLTYRRESKYYLCIECGQRLAKREQ